MRISPVRRAAVVAASLLTLLAGACTPRGDFGRPAPSIIGDRILPAAGWTAARVRGEPASWFMLTDDERELRARSYRFLMPAHEWQFVERVLADLARNRILPPAVSEELRPGYWQALRFSRGTSPAPLFRRIAQDMVQDTLLIPDLKAIAERVLASDRARLAFLVHVTETDETQAREAATRVAENRCLIAWIRAEARERIERYRYALERLVVEAPQREAIGPERALVDLRAAVAGLGTLDVGALDACADGIVMAYGGTPRPRPEVLPAIVPRDGIVYKD